MDQAGLARRDLVPYIGSRAKVSEVLSGKRSITMSMARALHRHLGIPADAAAPRARCVLRRHIGPTSNGGDSLLRLWPSWGGSPTILTQTITLKRSYAA